MDIYQGDNIDGVPHSEGILYLPNGDMLEGKWDNGIIIGDCTYSSINRSVYHGELKDYKYNGRCALILQNGDKLDSVWEMVR